jgi:6-phosphofructokinase 1
MDGEGGLLQYIERRLKENKHMVIVVAEGAGQDIIAQSIPSSEQQDASGNKLLLDIGLWLTHKIKVHATYQHFLATVDLIPFSMT